MCIWAAALIGTMGSAWANTPTGLPPDELVMAVPVERGSTFGMLMSRYGLPEAKLREIASGVHDLRVIRPERELQVAWQGDVATAVRYQLDEDRTLVLERNAQEWSARVDEQPYVSHVQSVEMTVRGSMWRSFTDLGLRDAEITKLNKVLEFVIDLGTEVHPDDKLTFVGDIRTAEGRAPRLGDIHAIRFVGRATSFEIVRFMHLDGSEDWYRTDGKSIKGAFLRSPLEFSSVSSGYSTKRFHPILGVNRPHRGTDLAAASGTPIRSVAEGTVVRAGFVSGHGNYVEVAHDGVFVTSYSHLSRIGVRKGQKVKQGEWIGKVGSTGLATGPHLHYQMWKNGAFVDPMRVALPLQKTLGDGEQAAFHALVELYGGALREPQLTSLRSFVLGG